MLIKKSLFLLLLCWSVTAQSQVLIQFMPEVYGRNINGLFAARILNPGQRQQVNLRITVTERGAGTVCVIKTPEFTLNAGNNVIPIAASRGAGISFATNKMGQLTSQSNTFAQGDYDYCYSLTFTRSDNPPIEQCFEYQLAPFAELNLIEPYDREKICDRRPMLTWQPLVPAVPGSRYQLVLTEVKSGQNATEALNYNQPVINQSGILSPVLPYPAISRELENKKKYTWQVTAYKEQTILNRSAIWEFTVDCQDSVKALPDDGYRDIEDLMKGNNYLAVGAVKFSLVNPYAEQNLKYSVQSISRPDKKVGRLPKITLKNGRNNIRIELTDINGFIEGNYYILTIYLADESPLQLRFQYREQP